MTLFSDRQDAGRKLAERLADYEGREDTLILALPRGGLPVALEVAKKLRAELDILIVRKLGVPGHEELAMGAIASGGVRYLNEHLVASLGIPEHRIERTTADEQAELKRRERLYRGDRPPVEVRGRTVILIDDGLATGATVRAGIAALKELEPARLIVAVPTAPKETCESLKNDVDEVICLATPAPFMAVGQSYRHFPQTSDEEVKLILDEAATIKEADRTDSARAGR